MKKIIIYPFLFAIYPVIFLYSHNVQEVLISNLYIPLTIAVLISVFLKLFFGLFIQDRNKSGLIATVFIIIFFTYGYLMEWLVSLNLFTLKHRHFLPSLLFLGGYISYFIYTVKKQTVLQKTSIGLNYLAIFLVIINLAHIVPHEIKKLTVTKEKQIEGGKLDSAEPNKYPDIYYIVLDEYASLDTIKNIWNYDNSGFANKLKKKGFLIAAESLSPFNETQLCLASYLNMEVVKTGKGNNYYRMIGNNKVINFLKSKGYTIAYFGNWYDIDRYKIDADYDFHFVSDKIDMVDEFTFMALNSTMLSPLSYLFQIEKETYNAIPYILNKLKEAPSLPGPKFVFAHIMSPHGPFLFDEKGEKVDKSNHWNWKDKKYYLGQYIFITEQINSLVDVLLKDSETPPVIVIQSDHGPRPSHGPKKEERLVIPDDEMYKIFNAYYFPTLDGILIENKTSPVDTFKIIFNKYFDANLK
jgi:hypothetical protein